MSSTATILVCCYIFSTKNKKRLDKPFRLWYYIKAKAFEFNALVAQ